ncbi:MAG: hypothetical protein H6673_11995 [Anaerolineales bacterium]|nr:hypothetical protein [Anaerolineales bacterium]
MNATPDELLALSAYIDNQLSPTERVALEQRLQQDTRLRAELESLQATVVLVRSLPTLKAPRNFTLDPAEFAKSKPSARIISLNTRWVSRVAGLASVAALLLVVFAVMLGGQADQSQDSPASSKLADSNVVDQELTDQPLAMTAVAEAPIATNLPTQTVTPLPQPTASSAPTLALASGTIEDVTAFQGQDGMPAYSPPAALDDFPDATGGIVPPSVPVPPGSGEVIENPETDNTADTEALGMGSAVGATGGDTDAQGVGSGGGDGGADGMEADDGMSPPDGYTEVAPAVMPSTIPEPQVSAEAARSIDMTAATEESEVTEREGEGEAADEAIATFSTTNTDADRNAADLLTPVLEWWDAFIEFLSRVLFYGWWH